MSINIKDKDIHNIFEQIKAPDASAARLQEVIAEGNEKKRKFYYRPHHTIIAACCLLMLLAVSSASANKSIIHKYTNQFMEYFYGKNQTDITNNSSAKKTVENSTDGKTRTEQVGEFRLTIYDTISYYSTESQTRLGCMYCSVEFTDPNSKNILAIWDSTGKQRFFDYQGEIEKKDITSEKYNTWIDMEVSNGDDAYMQYLYDYDEQKSSSGKYYFAARWYTKDSQDKALGNFISDQVALTLTDYAIEFDTANNLDYGEQWNSHRYQYDGIVFHYQADTEEKVFELSDGYTLHVNAIGIWLTKQKKQSKAEARKEENSNKFEKIEKKFVSQVEKKRSSTIIKYNGQTYSLSELAPIALDGVYLDAINTSNHGRWISAASFFENPMDIDQIEVVY